jgi:hypothetical protein
MVALPGRDALVIEVAATPLGLWGCARGFTQGSPGFAVATLGWIPKRLWRLGRLSALGLGLQVGVGARVGFSSMVERAVRRYHGAADFDQCKRDISGRSQADMALRRFDGLLPQGGCGGQPRVVPARPVLPWVSMRRMRFNPNGVEAGARS